jgi:2,3-bisphosphoglycerate-independent phosphoglycerate mutase
MKTLILQGDGLAGLPIEELGGASSLQKAHTPGLDHLAQVGEYGCFKLSGDGFPLTGDILHLSLLGADPKKYMTGSGAFAGAGLDVVLGPQDVAYLCNLVTIGLSEGRVEKKIDSFTLLDDVAGGIKTEEARELIEAINEELGSESIQFYTGSRHRHLMVWVNGAAKVSCCDPHQAVGQEIKGFLPSGKQADILIELMDRARIILKHHPINDERGAEGLLPANGIWVWAPGKSVTLPNMKERCGLSGIVLSESEQHLGIGRYSGLTALNPVNDEAEIRDRYQQLTESALANLRHHDVVYLHVDEEPKLGPTSLKEKIERLELFDQQLVSRLIKDLPDVGPFRLLVTCNHWRTFSSEPEAQLAPFAFWNNQDKGKDDKPVGFNEMESTNSGILNDPLKFSDRLTGKA